MAGDGQGQSPFTPQANGGEFLLSLLQRPTNRPSQSQSESQSPNPQLQIDPAVAAVGPSITSLQPPWPSNGSDLLYPVPLSPWSHSSHQPLLTPVPPNFIGFQQLHNPFPLPPPPPPHNHFSGTQFGVTQSSLDDSKRLGFSGNHDKLQFGSFSPTLIPQVMVNGNSSVHNSKREVGFGESIPNGFNRNQHLDSHVNSSFNSYGNSDVNVHTFHRGEFTISPRRGGGFGENKDGGNHHLAKDGGNWDLGNIKRRDLELGLNKEKVFLGGFGFNDERGNKFSGRDGKVYGERSHGFELDHHGRHPKSSLQSVSAFNNTEATMLNLHSEIVEGRDRDRHQGRGWMKKDVDSINGNVNEELDNIGEQLVDSLLHDDEPDEKTDAKHIRREKDCRGDHLLTQRMRLYKRRVGCRGDIDMLTIPLLSIYKSLIPPNEEKERQKQLLTSLEKLVVKEWPSAHLYTFGSCANSFGVSNSDIDICLVLRKPNIDKSEIILKLADILQSANLQNVQALTRARVPIIKLKDSGTGISCDICINNVLAVVNTKLLRDYAQIDVRLQQLAFIVKHWAKSRGVNETYQGTLSSYAYVLMCIHFLQHRRPAILPCLQEMQITFHELVDDVECAYFDKVEQLQTFGSHNKESIAQLVWGFFNYWAYGHDYANAVISVRTGSIISKRAKDWTRRVGNDRHLICIEDPFETSHDLGRVVDKYSIRVLREEFERAAEILQYDPSPCERLFEPYIPI